ncbi:putative AAA+ ATPase domain, ATPase, AAA-type, core, AAA ATPase, AAA+ lid domain-containing protein [Helianthus annuus]|nr:putative AAA+ ATPase domain, ATPase, AAA-type, core, AAA ATPase, AAA+ lid domain-containing protein [Helianthus annuus]
MGRLGCGKTTLANAIANEAGVPFYNIAAPELVYGVSGESEEKIRELFSNAHKPAPSIVFIDEIDTIASKRENLQREMDKRIVTQLMICMDAASKCEDGKLGYVLVIGATNRPDALDRALRRPGRFDREITLGVPDENARTKILRVLTRNGFVGTDLVSLVDNAGRLCMRRSIEAKELELSAQDEDWWKKPWTLDDKANLITMSDFEEAVKLVQPSTKREGFTSIPRCQMVKTLEVLIGLRMKFNEYIVNRIKDPVAYECGIYLVRARTCSPCIIFFDELLSELDGGDPRKGVYVIGATNSFCYKITLDVIDRALLRSGRFGEILYVTLPNQDERGLILKTLSKHCSLDADVDLIAIARSKACENLSGADLKRMMAKAAMVAHRENCSKIKAVHFEKVLKKIKPSVTDKVKLN